MSDNLRRSSRRSKKRDYSVGDIVELEVSKYTSFAQLRAVAIAAVGATFWDLYPSKTSYMHDLGSSFAGLC